MTYNPNFQWKRKTITISVPTSSLPAGYQIKLVIPKETEMQSDFRDLRFETTGGYGLPHWLESINTTPNPDEATVWVKLKDTVTASALATVDIHMYYGNPYVSSASNGTNTFDFFDDFLGSSINSSKWTVIGTAPIISNSIADLSVTNSAINTASFSTQTIPYAMRTSTKFIGELTGIGFNDAASASRALFMAWFARPASTLVHLSGWGNVNAYTYNVYHIFEIIYNPNVNIIFKVDETTIRTEANDVPLNEFFTITTGDPGAHIYTDWILARRVVTTEPTVPSAATIAGLTPSIVNWNPQRKKITVNTTTATPTNYQVKITVPFAPEMNIDFSDLRFTTDDAIPVELSYWIESYTAGVEAIVWVKLNALISVSTTDYIYMHYGNPNLTSASNGTNTFEFFDHFEGSSLDLTKWNIYYTLDSYSLTVANSNLVMTAAYNSGAVAIKSGMLSVPYVLEYRANVPIGNLGFFNGIYKSTNTNSSATADQFAVFSSYNGAATTVETDGTNYNIGSISNWAAGYNKFKIVRNSSGYSDFYINNNLVDNSHTYASAASSMIVFCDYQSSNIQYVDWALIRKYVATEPTIDQTAAAEAMNVFTSRKKLTINNNSGGALTDYQVPITVTYAPTMQANFNDIRFVDASGDLLPYWIESIANTIPAATGGTVTTSGGDRIHTFTSNGTFTSIKSMNVEVLVVAAGGAGLGGSGGGFVGGGGGGGGLVYNSSKSISTQNYAVIVGEGAFNAAGGNSSIFDILALGGGIGGSQSVTGGQSGGSGGGGAYASGIGGLATQGNSGGLGYGNAGYKAGASDSYNGGGGGGAGAGDANTESTTGAAGKSYNISGTLKGYAGGGGAGNGNNIETRYPGRDGGGSGGSLYYKTLGQANGTPNTGGGGGGGGSANGGGVGGAGGSGIIIIRYPTIEDIVGSGTTATVWIKVNLAAGDNVVYMYYGNPNAASASDISNTMVFGDDFLGTTLDTSKWENIGSVTVSVSGSVLSTTSSGYSTGKVIMSKSSLGAWDNFIIEFYGKADGSGDSYELGSFIRATDPSVSKNGYMQSFYDYAGTWGQIGTYVSGSWSSITGSGTPTTNWFRAKAEVNGSTIKSYVNGSLVVTDTGATEFASGRIGLGNGGNTRNGKYDWIFVRKYSATEPTVTTSAEQTITATYMSIVPSELPCRVGICTVNVHVTWTNTGDSIMFTPSITIDDTTYSLYPRSLPTDDTIIDFEVLYLSAGNHTICPYPN